MKRQPRQPGNYLPKSHAGSCNDTHLNSTATHRSHRIFHVHDSLNHDQGLAIIRSVVAECLARDVVEILPENRLITDLGADSLDFVDLIFTLEKRFGVKIQENDLNITARVSAENGNADFLAPEAISRLLPWLPELATLGDLARVRPVQVFPLITVEALWRLVQEKKNGSVSTSSLSIQSAPDALRHTGGIARNSA